MSRGASAALAIGLAFAAFLAPAVARAGEVEDFERARSAYESRDFQRAVYYFEELVGGDVPRLQSPSLVTEARKYLGAAYLFVGQREAARRQFELLLRAEPSYHLDPLLFPSEVLELFASVEERLDLERRDTEARRILEARAQREHDRAERLVAFAEQPVSLEVPSSRWLALFPFGVGQFINDDQGLGWFFLLTETALAGAAFGSLAWHQSLTGQVSFAQSTRLNGDEVLRGDDLLRAAFITNWVAIGALAVMAIAGVVEAQFRFVPSRTVTDRRRVPDELRGDDEDEVIPAPTSGLRFDPARGFPLSFRF